MIMVGLKGQSSNHLFETLEDWNGQLKSANINSRGEPSCEP